MRSSPVIMQKEKAMMMTAFIRECANDILISSPAINDAP